jgi:hypothetical protein
MQNENFTLFTKLIQKTFELSRNSDFPNDGIVACKMIMALFENINPAAGLPNLLEPLYPDILSLLWQELQFEVNQKKKKHRELVSMVIQSFCLAFYTNSELTFQVLQDKGILLPFFQAWVELLKGGKVKHDFELRKQLLGLSGIYRTDPVKIPAEVKQGLP